MIHFPDWAKNLTIYEVNVRQFTAEGTFAAFRNHLPRLKELGVGIIWFMPVQPIGVLNRKGSLGSYYSIADYVAVNPEFGTFQEFVDLVAEIHASGMYVILDWVANHTAWDHVWTKSHPDFYISENGNFCPPFDEWSDVIKLDYSNQKMRAEMNRSMLFWIKNAKIDGFRCDMAHLVPTDFWNDLSGNLFKKYPQLYMLAETDHYDLLENAFHSSYDWKVFHAMNEYAAGKISLDDLKFNITDQLAWYPEKSSILRFISNHDENSWHGSELVRLGLHLETMTVLSFMLPGIPLIYSGQEAGNERSLPFFDKDEIRWKEDKMKGLLKDLIKLRKENKALWCFGKSSNFHFIDVPENENLMAFIRKDSQNRVFVVLNFSNEIRQITLNMNELNGNYKLHPSGADVIINSPFCLVVEPYKYRIFVSSESKN